jgi:ribosomal 50S subunit-recycling heat shock protein
VEKVELKLESVRAADVVPQEGGGAIRVISRDSRKNENTGQWFPVRIDKLIRQVGLASSNTEAAAKLKGGAVSIDGQNIGAQELVVGIYPNSDVVLRVGRKIKKVRLTLP